MLAGLAGKSTHAWPRPPKRHAGVAFGWDIHPPFELPPLSSAHFESSDLFGRPSMAQRRPGSPSVGRGGGLAARRALVLLAALPMCIAFYRLCSAGGMGGGSGAAAGSGGPRRRLGGDVLEVPRPLEQRVHVAASLVADSAAQRSDGAALELQEPADPAQAAEQQPEDTQPASQQAVLPSSSTAVVAGTASVHGLVHKAGPLSPKLWMPHYRQWRRDRRQAWLDQRQKNLAAGGTCWRAFGGLPWLDGVACCCTA